MNTKGKKGIIGITLVAIMIASIFAVIAPISADDVEGEGVEPQGYVDASKVATRDPKIYAVGEDVTYDLTITNDHPTSGVTFDVYDQFAYDPEGPAIWTGIHLNPGAVWTDTITFTIGLEDVTPGGFVINNLRINGTEDVEPHLPVTGTVSEAIVIEFPCEFDFAFEDACCGLINFTGTSTGAIVNHSWDFGSGATPAELEDIVGAPDGKPPITVDYSTCGLKTVTLSGFCSPAGSNYTTHNVYVDCGPTAVAKATPACFEIGGSDITFDGTGSTYDTRPIVSWNWTFSDGGVGTSDDQNVTTRMVNEEITATLEVFDGHCYSTDTVTVKPCSQCSLRIYGTFDRGPGDHTVTDPVTGLAPENKPYTDPVGPFNPQNAQAPRKDFITFNPAIMDHNQGYDLLIGWDCVKQTIVQRPQEKVFKRMWYEKEWFKDHDHDGVWDVVVDTPAGVVTMTLDAWNAIPAWIKERDGLSIREWNNDPTINDSNVDIYGPAINQEFTYMFLDDERMPILTRAGSVLYMPMASRESGNGLDSFDALLGDGVLRDAVRVESEQTVGIDIDGDGLLEPMGDLTELNGDESVVFVLENKFLEQGDTLQFFDHVVTLTDVQEIGAQGRAVFDVCDNEGGGSQRCTENVVMNVNDVTTYHRGRPGTAAEAATFYVRLVSADAVDNTAIVEVGRMFGQPYANIGGTNPYWSQKAFMVDGVFYNVVAIKALDNCFKYITFRQKLPKMPIKLYGKHLEVWGPRMPLPEMPPFNMDHEICVDVWDTWTVPHSQQDKIGPKKEMPPLVIDYIYEDIEERYKGELKEIYNETSILDEYWDLEWFWTLPWQYTELRLPKEDKYLVTLSWFAPESEIVLWDGEANPVADYRGERFKFWYQDCTGPIYIDNETSSIRLYGTFDEGPGDHTVTDPVTGLAPENPPYTDPRGPFDPQHPQAPVKDFMTFNPAIMDHNQGYPELDYWQCALHSSDVQTPQEKVFKRMWYEKEWFKDHDSDGVWDVVVDTPQGVITMPLAAWNAIPVWIKERDGLSIREWNNDPTIEDSNVDIYGPAISRSSRIWQWMTRRCQY